MKIFEDRKITLLREKVEAHKRDAHINGKFSLFDAKFSKDAFSGNNSYDYLNWHYDLLLDWDEKCNLPYEIGVSLDKLAEDNTVMIHRTRLDLDSDSSGLDCNDSLYSIMNDGLKNYGHANAVGGGAYSDLPPSLTLTMTPLTGTAGYINLLASYHSNDAVIISAFPKDLVDSTGEIINNPTYDQVYDLSEYPPRVRKGFMVGAILKKNNGLDEFYTRDEIIDSYNNSKKSGVSK